MLERCVRQIAQTEAARAAAKPDDDDGLNLAAIPFLFHRNDDETSSAWHASRVRTRAHSCCVRVVSSKSDAGNDEDSAALQERLRAVERERDELRGRGRGWGDCVCWCVRACRCVLVHLRLWVCVIDCVRTAEKLERAEERLETTQDRLAAIMVESSDKSDTRTWRRSVRVWACIA
jgi:hypothetical protein